MAKSLEMESQIDSQSQSEVLSGFGKAKSLSVQRLFILRECKYLNLNCDHNYGSNHHRNNAIRRNNYFFIMQYLPTFPGPMGH